MIFKIDKPKQYPTKEGKCMCCGQYTKYLNAIELQYIGGTYVDWRCLRCYYEIVKSKIL